MPTTTAVRPSRLLAVWLVAALGALVAAAGVTGQPHGTDRDRHDQVVAVDKWPRRSAR